MSHESAEDAPLSPASGEDAAASREQVIARIHYLFRLAGNTPPAVALRQQIMAYRLMEKAQ